MTLRRWWDGPDLVQWRYMQACGDYTLPFWCWPFGGAFTELEEARRQMEGARNEMGTAKIEWTATKHADDSATPLEANLTDLLDWDAAVLVAPKRKSGTMAERLKYAGRATPSPTESPEAK